MAWAFALVALAVMVALGFRSWPRSRRDASTLEGSDGESMVLVVLVLVALSAAPFFVHEHGWYLGDTQFLFNWNPARALSDAASIWQTRADLGGNTAVGTVVPNAYLAALRALGAPAWLAQRLWFATLVASGSVATACVTRFFTPRSRIAPLVAGLAFIASPFTVAYLSPSWLYASAAICPWLVLSVLRGTTTRSRWRWAALPALVISAAIFNPPAIFFATLPAVAAIVYVRISGRAGWRAVLQWLWRVALFAVPALAPLVVVFWFQRGASRLTLASTESVDAIRQSSTWAESLRGLGGWLTYWNPSRRLVMPYVAPYMTNWLVVVLTFVPVAAAFLVVAFVPKRARLLFAAVLIGCAALMVGVFARSQLPPLGTVLDHFYRSVPGSLAFRNVYKAGAGLVLAMAVLLGFGAEWAVHRWRRPRTRLALSAAAVLVLGATSFPLWSGAILRTNQRLHGDIPTYWTAAMHWLDTQPGDGRVMITPLSNDDQYRWGTTAGGDMFSARMERPAVLGGIFPASSGDAANLLQALATYVSSGRYEPGTFAPIARRLGIAYLVIRNDLDWQHTGGIRPADDTSLRFDPGLERVATFGQPGENTTAADDHSRATTLERRLPPVEVFRVRNNEADQGGVRALTNAPSLLVSGDGEAWPELAGAQLLDRLGPVRYSGRVDRSTLAAELARGATVAITDTNRRRSVAYGVQNETLPLSATERVGDLFGRTDTQTVATYGDASSIVEVGPPQLFRAGVSHGAWAAFDGDPATSWLTGPFAPDVGEGLEVRLRGPRSVSSLSVTAAQTGANRSVTGVRMLFDQGAPIDLALGVDGTATAEFPARTVRHFTLEVRAAGPGIGSFGLSDVKVGNLDLGRRLQLPSDVARAAHADRAIASSLSSAPTRYLFSRSRGLVEDAEPTLRRRFEVAEPRRFSVAGVVQVTDSTPDPAVTRLVGGAYRATADPPAHGGPPPRGSNATDGNPATSWVVADGTSSSLHTFALASALRTVELHVRAADARKIAMARLVADGVDLSRPGSDCVPEVTADPSVPATTCTITFELPGAPTAAFTVSVQAQGGDVHVREVTRNAEPNRISASPRCRTDLLQIDGAPVGVTLGGTVTDLLAGREVPLMLCDSVELSSGWHDLSAAPSVPLDTVRLDALGGRPSVFATRVGTVTDSRSATSLGVHVAGTSAAWLISGQAMAADWTIRGASPAHGPTIELDTQAGWRLSAGASRDARISFTAQGAYRIALWLSFLALGAAAVVMVIDPKLCRRRVPGSRPVNRQAWLVALEVLGIAFAFGIGGALQAFVVIAALALFRRRVLTPTVVVLSGAVLMVLAAVTVVPPYGPSLTPVDPAWPVRRGSAHFLALQAVVLLVAGMVGFARTYLRPRMSQRDDDPPSSTRDRVRSDHRTGQPTAPGPERGSDERPTAAPQATTPTRSRSTRQFQASTSRAPGTARIQRWDG